MQCCYCSRIFSWSVLVFLEKTRISFKFFFDEGLSLMSREVAGLGDCTSNATNACGEDSNYTVLQKSISPNLQRQFQQ